MSSTLRYSEPPLYAHPFVLYIPIYAAANAIPAAAIAPITHGAPVTIGIPAFWLLLAADPVADPAADPEDDLEGDADVAVDLLELVVVAAVFDTAAPAVIVTAMRPSSDASVKEVVVAWDVIDTASMFAEHTPDAELVTTQASSTVLLGGVC